MSEQGVWYWAISGVTILFLLLASWIDSRGKK